MYNALIKSEKAILILHLSDMPGRHPLYVHLLKYFNVHIETSCHRLLKKYFYPIKMTCRLF